MQRSDDWIVVIFANQHMRIQSAIFDYAYYVVIWHVDGGIRSQGDNCIQLRLCTDVHATVTALNSNVEALGSQHSTGIARLVPQLAHSSCKTSNHKLR